MQKLLDKSNEKDHSKEVICYEKSSDSSKNQISDKVGFTALDHETLTLAPKQDQPPNEEYSP